MIDIMQQIVWPEVRPVLFECESESESEREFEFAFEFEFESALAFTLTSVFALLLTSREMKWRVSVTSWREGGRKEKLKAPTTYPFNHFHVPCLLSCLPFKLVGS